MKRFWYNLKVEAEEKPMLAIGLATGALMAISKFIDATGLGVGKRAYARDAKRRSRKK